MPVAVVQDFEGGTLEQYDEVVDKMGLRRGGPGIAGSLFHWVTATDDGIRVTAVWETVEQFRQFDEEKLEPLLATDREACEKFGTIHEVHNYTTAGER